MRRFVQVVALRVTAIVYQNDATIRVVHDAVGRSLDGNRNGNEQYDTNYAEHSERHGFKLWFVRIFSAIRFVIVLGSKNEHCNNCNNERCPNPKHHLIAPEKACGPSHHG